MTAMVCYACAANAQTPQQGEMAVDSVALREIVVNASRPVSKMTEDGILTTVAGSPLQQLGTARDVLKFIPGIVSANGSIEVLGKGTPAIYINGRRVYNTQEIDQLASYRVKDVTVIANPGAKYSSEISAVIKISTVKNLGDGFALDNRLTGGYSNYAYCSDVLWMNYREGGLDVFSTLEYDNGKKRRYNDVVQDNVTNGNSSTLSMHRRLNERQQKFDGKIGFNYAPDDNHIFGAFYQASHTPTRTNIKGFSHGTIASTPYFESETAQRESQNDNRHLIDAYYAGRWGSFVSNITFNALWHNNDASQNTIETYPQADELRFRLGNESRGRMFAGKIDLSRALWKGSINFGSEYTNSRRTETVASDFAQIAASKDKINENNLGIYAEATQRFGQSALQVGLRYEHISSEYFENGVKLNARRKTYNEALPSISFTTPLSGAQLQISYTRKYTRPHYSQLSSAVIYANPAIYETGNPHLKSAYSNVVAANIMWRKVVLMASYTHTTDKVIDAASPYEGADNVTLLTKVNSARALHNLQLMAQYQPGMIGRYYYPVLAAGVVAQFYDIDFRGATKSMNNPMGMVKWMNIFMLPNSFRAGLNLTWRSDFDADNVHSQGTWSADVNISRTFGQHWELKLGANDIFNTSATNKFRLYSATQIIDITKRLSNRSVEFTVNYRFNVTKSKYLGAGAGKAESSRL